MTTTESKVIANGSLGRSFGLNSEISIDDQLYIKDLSTVPREYLPKALKEFEPFIEATSTFLTYLREVFMDFFLMLMTNWTLPLTQPFNFIMIILIYLSSIIFLLPATIFLSIANFMKMEFPLYDEESWQTLTTERLSKIRERGMAALGTPVPVSYVLPNFNLDMAETLLFLASVVYLRKEDKVHEAVNHLKNIQENLNKQDIEKTEIEKVIITLDEADSGVNNVISDWEDLKFKSVSELSTTKGVYAGLFWSVKENFIVLSFKGTSPTNFLELVVNFTFHRHEGRGFLFGGVHEGFYNCLFPKYSSGSVKSKKGYPHHRIIEVINAKAKEIRNTNKKTDPVNIWITGHSLGASLATLFYSRLLKKPDLLNKDNCVLRDVYSFASLAVGDSDFSAEFSSRYNESNSTLWRIICEQDIAPHLPPNNGRYQFLRRYLAKNDILNYFHVGDMIKFYHNNKKPRGDQLIFNSSIKATEDNQKLTWNDWKKLLNNDELSIVDQKVNNNSNIYNKTLLPYENVLKLPVLSMLRNHIPHRYFAAMEKSRPYFSKE